MNRDLARLSAASYLTDLRTSMERRIDCRWEGATVTVGMEEAGSGSSVVLLPALGSISTRAEMRPLLDRLASNFHVTTVDWPGFGDLPRPRTDWSPDALSAFLNWVLERGFNGTARPRGGRPRRNLRALSCRVLSRCPILLLAVDRESGDAAAQCLICAN
jgi:hypothetical protein